LTHNYYQVVINLDKLIYKCFDFFYEKYINETKKEGFMAEEFDDEDYYNDEAMDELREEDEIDDTEEAFLKGYEDDVESTAVEEEPSSPSEE
jgi:hypothetical protein